MFVLVMFLFILVENIHMKICHMKNVLESGACDIYLTLNFSVWSFQNSKSCSVGARLTIFLTLFQQNQNKAHAHLLKSLSESRR